MEYKQTKLPTKYHSSLQHTELSVLSLHKSATIISESSLKCIKLITNYKTDPMRQLLELKTQLKRRISTNKNNMKLTDAINVKSASFKNHSWSLTSPFSTNMAISETKCQGWRAIPSQWRKASDILTSTLAAFLFSTQKRKGSRGSFKLLC